MEKDILSEINAEIGNKVENISKGNFLVEKYVKQLNEIEKKVKTKILLSSSILTKSCLISANSDQRKCFTNSQENPCRCSRFAGRCQWKT
jgi:hypothetical protein